MPGFSPYHTPTGVKESFLILYAQFEYFRRSKRRGVPFDAGPKKENGLA